MLKFLIKNKGDDLSWIAEQAAKRGTAPPDMLKNRPTLRPDLEFHWSAFNDLLTETDFNGNIRWSSITQYADRYGVPFESFRYIIRALERARKEAVK